MGNGEEKNYRKQILLPLTVVISIIILTVAAVGSHYSLASCIQVNSQKIVALENRFDEFRDSVREVRDDLKIILNKIELLQKEMSELKGMVKGGK